MDHCRSVEEYVGRVEIGGSTLSSIARVNYLNRMTSDEEIKGWYPDVTRKEIYQIRRHLKAAQRELGGFVRQEQVLEDVRHLLKKRK